MMRSWLNTGATGLIGSIPQGFGQALAS